MGCLENIFSLFTISMVLDILTDILLIYKFSPKKSNMVTFSIILLSIIRFMISVLCIKYPIFCPAYI